MDCFRFNHSLSWLVQSNFCLGLFHSVARHARTRLFTQPFLRQIQIYPKKHIIMQELYLQQTVAQCVLKNADYAFTALATVN